MLAEGIEGVVQAGFDCAQWDVQRVGDFLQRHFLDETYEQHVAMLDGQ